MSTTFIGHNSLAVLFSTNCVYTRSLPGICIYHSVWFYRVSWRTVSYYDIPNGDTQTQRLLNVHRSGLFLRSFCQILYIIRIFNYAKLKPLETAIKIFFKSRSTNGLATETPVFIFNSTHMIVFCLQKVL